MRNRLANFLVAFLLLLHHFTAAAGEEEEKKKEEEEEEEDDEEEEVAISRLQVPSLVERGDDVELGCRWLGPQDKLYSLKWYLDDREFFRFKPEEEPSVAVHPLPGVVVNRELSTGEKVVLDNVDLSSSGKYKCEVIAESPNFHTADKSALMTVVHIPEKKPRIYGTKHEYHIGDTAQLTCVSALSRPAADLTWFINDEEAPKDYIVPLNGSFAEHGLIETRKALRFVVSRKHFRKGEMNLRCSAKISSLYYKTQQHSVDGQLTYSVPVMESRDISAMAGSNRNLHSDQQHLLVICLAAFTLLLERLLPILLERVPS